MDNLTHVRQSAAEFERMRRDFERLPELEAEVQKELELDQARRDFDHGRGELAALAEKYQGQKDEAVRRFQSARREAQAALNEIENLIRVWANQCNPAARKIGYNQCKLGQVPWPNVGPITEMDVKACAEEALKNAGIDPNVEQFRGQAARLQVLLD